MGVGALIGAAFGAAAGGAIAGVFGLTLSWTAGMMLGASIGSLFDKQNMDFGAGTNTPNYSFGPISNSKTQLLPVPIVYGKCRVAGNIFMQLFEDDSKTAMDLFVGIGEGPINKVVRVAVDDHILYGDGADTGITYWALLQENENATYEWTQVQFDFWNAFTGTKEMRDADGEKTELQLTDCSVDVHLGTSGQPVDEREPEGYAYPNTAYVALTLKAQNGLSGNPTVTSIVEGKIVWTPSGERYTRNPAWIVLDFITATRYGVGLPMDMIDLDSFREVAAYCDQVVDGGPRYQLDFIIDQQRPALDHLQDMLSTFQAYIQFGDKIKLAVDRAESSYTRELTADNFVEGTFGWWTKSDEERYNRIVIEWIDPDMSYERSSAVFEDEADIIANGIKEQSISLLGITNPAQVGRIGAYLMETAQKVRIHCSFMVGINALDVDIGDVVAITYPEFTGWNKKWFRVQSMTETEDDLVELVCVEYGSTIYTRPGIPFQKGKEEKPKVEHGDVHSLILSLQGRIEPDGTYIPDVLAEWQLPTTYTPRNIEVRYTYSDDPSSDWIVGETLPGDAKACLLKGLIAERTATVHVRAIRPVDGLYTTGVLGEIFLSKDLVAPGAPTDLAAEGWFGSIFLTWKNPPDHDLSHIEIWEYHEDGLYSTDEDFEEKAVMVGRVNAESYERKLGSFQTRWYWVRAVDHSGNKSPFNLPEGTPGNSEQENHEDFVKELLQREEVAELINELNEPVQDLRPLLTEIIASWEGMKELVNVRMQLKEAAGAIGDGTFTGWEGWKYHNAIVAQEKEEREAQDEVLSELVTSVVASIGDPSNPAMGTVFAAVQEEMRARVTADTALAEQITNLFAYIGNPDDPEGTLYGAINDVRRVMIENNTVVTQQINTLVAAIGNPNNPTAGSVFAAIRDERDARVSADSALTNMTTTLQTQLGGNIASVQTLQNTMNGIQSEYVIKTDVNGHVAGMGILNKGIGKSAVVFHTDTFLIGRPGGSGTADYPFAMGYVNGAYRISMSNAFIQDAAIDTAKIRDLAVDTLKIKGRAVTIPSGIRGTRAGLTGSGTSVATLSIAEAMAGQPTLLIVDLLATVNGRTSVYFTATQGAQQLLQIPFTPILSGAEGNIPVRQKQSATRAYVFTPATSGTVTVTIRFYGPAYGSGEATDVEYSLSMIHCKR